MANKTDSLKNNCSNALLLKDYLLNKAKNHNHYKTYSTIDRIVSIRDNQALFLADGKKWNDIPDRDSFTDRKNGYINFGRCFSFSQDENVAMWMLYGGMHKNGGMIDFTKKGMLGILSCKTVELGRFQDDIFVSEKTVTDFSMTLTDVIYYKKNGKAYYISRYDESFPNLSPRVFNSLSFCKKTYPWNYENECRLIISVKAEDVPKDCDIVKIDLSGIDLGKSFERIYRAPNYSSSEYMGSVQSTLTGSIDWDLCKGCKT